ncbi:MAG: hypothetical protein QM680_06560 [Luteolibacter sp.]
MKRATNSAKKTARKPPVNVLTVEDPELNQRQEAEEKQREEAFYSEFMWKGKELQPFSSGRESLFHQIRLAAGAPDFASVLDDVDAFLADAIRILYLCSCEPQDWRHLRSTPLLWQEEIENWGDFFVPNNEKAQAVLLAMQILEKAYLNRHEPAPETGARKSLGK